MGPSNSLEYKKFQDAKGALENLAYQINPAQGGRPDGTIDRGQWDFAVDLAKGLNLRRSTSKHKFDGTWGRLSSLIHHLMWLINDGMLASPASVSRLQEPALNSVGAPENKTRVERYLAEASARASEGAGRKIRITKRMFWQARGYESASTFEAWQRNDPDPNKNTAEAQRNFEGQLNTPILDFLNCLREKKLIG